MRVAVTGVLLVGLAFCGATLRTPPLGPHAENAQQVEVDYPPPAARVEHVPPDPGGECVWVDGNWEWRGRQWDWRSGNWYVPPAGCHYASARLAWIDSARGGALYFTPPNWYPSEDIPAKNAKPCKPVACGLAGDKTGNAERDRAGDGG
jgi:hypothetical protein